MVEKMVQMLEVGSAGMLVEKWVEMKAEMSVEMSVALLVGKWVGQ